MTDPAYQFNSVKRMKDAGITRHDKSDAGVLAFGEPLSGDIRFKFKESNRLLNTGYIFFADGRGFVDDTRDGGDGNLCATGNIFYADF